MSDDKTSEPMSDEAIAGVVQFIEGAELLSKSIGLSVSRAAEMMLKSAQIMQRIQAAKGLSVLHAMVSPSKKVS